MQYRADNATLQGRSQSRDGHFKKRPSCFQRNPKTQTTENLPSTRLLKIVKVWLSVDKCMAEAKNKAIGYDTDPKDLRGVPGKRIPPFLYADGAQAFAKACPGPTRPVLVHFSSPKSGCQRAWAPRGIWNERNV